MTKEEDNVFRDAKFGDRFLTRNGHIMIYQKQAREDVYCLFDEYGDGVIEYRPNGDVIYEYTGDAKLQEDDIIGRYPSLPSNLDEAAEEYAYTNWEDNDYHEGASEGVPFDPIGYTEKVFKAGAEWAIARLNNNQNNNQTIIMYGVQGS